MEWLPGEYAFKEVESAELLVGELADALAAVRDGSHWSILKRAHADQAEKFCLFVCHFSDGIPNSGFVGWLASEFKRRLGTGVFVLCGQNTARGGIFDYWGIPARIAEEAKHCLITLVESGRDNRA